MNIPLEVPLVSLGLRRGQVHGVREPAVVGGRGQGRCQGDAWHAPYRQEEEEDGGETMGHGGVGASRRPEGNKENAEY